MKIHRGFAKIFSVSVLAAGCAGGPKEPLNNVLQADEQMVSGCQYMGDVTGFSMVPGPSYVERCKTDALEKAGELGATHLLWTSVENGASGKAYKCATPAAVPAAPAAEPAETPAAEPAEAPAAEAPAAEAAQPDPS